MTDAIYIGALQPATLAAIHAYVERQKLDGMTGRTWWDLDQLAGLLMRLKYTPDDARLFPHGKWATLQFLESLIEAAIQRDNREHK